MTSFHAFTILNALDSLDNAYSMSDELRKLDEIKRNFDTVILALKTKKIMALQLHKDKDESYSEVKETDDTGIDIEHNPGTQDMDALTFGIKSLVQHLTESEFDLELVLKGMNVTMEQFVDICTLYGPNRTLEFIKEWEKIEGLIRDNPKYKNVKDCNKEMIECDISERDVLNCDCLDNTDYNADDDHCDDCLFQKTANQLLFILNNNFKQSSSSLFHIVADGFMNDLKTFNDIV